MKELTTTIKEVKKYKQINNTIPKIVRGWARDLVLNGLSIKTKFTNTDEFFGKPRIQFLYIHHVFEDEIQKFDKLLDFLSKYHSFISYSDAVNKILTKSIDKPYICLSSDDGFKNNLSAVNVMNKYGIKACFFVNPDTIGLKDDAKIKSFCIRKFNFPPTEFMDWKDLEYLIKDGHEIGSHTMGHINIAETNILEVEDNLNQSYQILNQRIGGVTHFAYPYGRFSHFNYKAFDLVFKAGFTSCASAERGCHVVPLNELKYYELLIRRDHVICDWDLSHIQYFILNNSKNANFTTNYFPKNHL
jgi:peptidoglycan/xylan/chitin deacetylase (PgdA/CDA1 family)